ncbi:MULTISPECIES: glucosaminidase domain-containing protein [unclassified Parabacteroides]|uniref:glucosaminidase domain-containing protein n=1 Tax=unclassified Parabacteroides TaxID=2649774 RepID=UPI0024761FE5|nr:MULTISPECIES: glucosaminidase domain-containing protein [unclassified Parabacteroides]
MLGNVRFCGLVCLLFFINASVHAESQRKISSYEKYIKEYSHIAVQQQQTHKIPASITLAQGLLESGAGQSVLAKKSNNHFGIKCHDWTGAKVYHNDDKKNECFRKYKNVAESYEDHSQFLTSRSRYSDLFKLNQKDYKGWAKGLQKSGYATDKAYANKLIKLIEDYELYNYDSGKTNVKTSPEKKPSSTVTARTVYKAHGLNYVYAESNDALSQIAEATGIQAKDLRKFNEIPEAFPLQKGDIVYLVKKKKKADKPYYDHIVQIGESMHSISQKYGIQIKSLYKMNKKKEDYIPTEGDLLKLR